METIKNILKPHNNEKNHEENKNEQMLNER